MEQASEIVVRLTGGRRVEAQIGKHRVLTDQPRNNGGEDTAPSPFQLFLASLGTCAGIFVQGFCAKRGIPYEDIRVIERPIYGANGALESVELELQLPPDFPTHYHEALLRVIDQCSVKRVLQSPPTFKSQVSHDSLRTSPTEFQFAPEGREVPKTSATSSAALASRGSHLGKEGGGARG